MSSRLKAIEASKKRSLSSESSIKLRLGDETFAFEAGKLVEYDRHVKYDEVNFDFQKEMIK